MTLLRSLTIMLAVVAVSACTTTKYEEVESINEVSAVGNAFTQALTKEYRDYVNTELDNFTDHADSLHFSRKGLAAARGDMVMPEPVSDWNLLPGHAEELIVARSRLVNVYAWGAREMQPELSAFAQAKFDCWIEEQEENFQQDRISACKSAYMDAIAKLESSNASASTGT